MVEAPLLCSLVLRFRAWRVVEPQHPLQWSRRDPRYPLCVGVWLCLEGRQGSVAQGLKRVTAIDVTHRAKSIYHSLTKVENVSPPPT